DVAAGGRGARPASRPPGTWGCPGRSRRPSGRDPRASSGPARRDGGGALGEAADGLRALVRALRRRAEAAGAPVRGIGDAVACGAPRSRGQGCAPECRQTGRLYSPLIAWTTIP